MEKMKKRMSIQPKESMTIEEGLTEFLKHCKVRNYVVPTQRNYLYTVRKFGRYYNLNNKISSITIDIINGYVLSMQEENITEYSVATNVKNLRTVLYYFMAQEWLQEFKIRLPRAEKKLKSVYSDAELKLLLKKPNVKKCLFSEYRNWVTVNFFIATGIRLNSLINIRIKDLDFENEVVKIVKTKARSQVLLPLTGTLVMILKEYLRFRNGEPDDYLFCNQYGTQLTRDGLQNIIERYNHSRGVTKSSIHLFRHSFAQRYLLNGGDIFRLQKLMCHKDIRSTREYLELCTDDLKVNYNLLNPLETLTQNNSKLKMDKTNTSKELKA